MVADNSSKDDYTRQENSARESDRSECRLANQVRDVNLFPEESIAAKRASDKTRRESQRSPVRASLAEEFSRGGKTRATCRESADRCLRVT